MFSSLQQQVSSRPLGLFRILFGFLLLFQFYKISKRVPFFKDADYLYFPYPELDWVPVFGYPLLMALLVIGFVSVMLFTAGILYRYVAIVIPIVYGYFFSLDAVYYNNHYYLIFLISVLMAFSQADKSYSVSSLKSKRSEWVSGWQYIIFQLQLGIVFFYGGLSKCSKDWFDGNVIKGITESDIVNQFLIYGGTIFDMLIPFALFYKRTRWVAILLVLLFNISNHFLFSDIASFPLLVIAAMLLFIADSDFTDRLPKALKSSGIPDQITKTNLGLKLALGFFFIFQLLFPLRHHLIPGHVDWTGQGHYFAWRMKSYHKEVKVDLYAMDKTTRKRAYKINHGLDNYKIQRMASMPHMIPRLASYMRTQIEKQDGVNTNLGIQVDYHVAFNQRPDKIALNPSIDISRARFNKYAKNNWILNLE